jgi:hypothetical protein
MRSRHEEMRREDLRDDRACYRQRRQPRADAPAFVLQPGVRHGGQHDVPMPADKRAALEVIEPALVFQFLVLLLDGPPVVGQTHQRRQRRRVGEIDQAGLDPRRAPEIALEKQPDLESEASLAPIVGDATRLGFTEPVEDGGDLRSREGGAAHSGSLLDSTLASSAPRHSGGGEKRSSHYARASTC